MRTALDFRTSNGDTNYPDSDSVLPVTDGEAASQAILRRPTENVRNRSEVLRDYLQEHMLLQEMTPRLYQGYVFAMPCISFGGAYPSGSGSFSTTTDLVISNLATPGGDPSLYPYVRSTKATLNIGTPSSNELVFTSVKKQYESSAFPAADPNEIAVEIVAGSSLTVTTKGASGDLNHIYVTIISGTTTCQDVINAITASSPANTLVVVTLGAGSTGTNPAPLWGAAQWGGDYTRRFLKGGFPGTVHTISPTVLSTFFAASVDNLLQAGDSLCVWYDKSVDKSGTGGRLQSTYENSNYALSAGSLFNSRREPWKLPNSIPICKCVSGMPSNGVLLFADGSYIQENVPASLGADSFYLLNIWRGTVYATGWGWVRINSGVHAPPADIKETFDNVDYQLDKVMDIVEGLPIVVCGPGGQYTGSAAVQNAIADLQAAEKGGIIYVRQGYYSFTVTQAIEYPIHIIGEGPNNTIILTNVSSGSVMTYTTGTNKLRLSNLKLQYQTGTRKMISTWQTKNLHIDGCIIEGTIEALGGGITADHLFVTHTTVITGGSANCFELNGNYATIQDCEVQVNFAGAVAFYVTPSKGVTIERCKITVINGATAFLGNPQAGYIYDLTIKQCRIICSPFTTSTYVFDLYTNSRGSGGQYKGLRVQDISFEFTGAGSITTGIFAVHRMADGVIDGVRMDLGSYVLHYVDDEHGPVYVSGTGTVENISILNGKIPSMGIDGWELSLGAVFTFLAGGPESSGSTILSVNHLYWAEADESSPSYSGSSAFRVLSTQLPSRSEVNGGTVKLNDVQFDFYNLYKPASGSRQIMNLWGTVDLTYSNFQDGNWDIAFEMYPTSTGEPIRIHGCSFYMQMTDPFNTFMRSLSGLGPVTITGNTFMFFDCASAGNVFNFASAYNLAFSGNTVWALMSTTKGTTPYVFRIGSNCYYAAFYGNSVKYNSWGINLYVDAGVGTAPAFVNFGTYNALAS